MTTTAPATQLVEVNSDDRQETLSDIEQTEAHNYARRAYAPNTERAYTAAWEVFRSFCSSRGVCAQPAKPAAVLAAVLAWAGKCDVSTIDIRLAAIAFFHSTLGLADPTADPSVRVVLKGIRHDLGRAPSKKAPVMLDELGALITAAAGNGLAGSRDRALILVGWAGAFRRSELVALDVADAHIGERLVIQIRKSKTDQDGKGKVKVIPPIGGDLCPVQALRDWLQASGINSGPLFRAVDHWGHVRSGRLQDKTVARVIKKVAERAGLEPRQFAGHSLRSGFITSAAIAGASSRDIMELTGHKSEAVMRGYIQDAGLGAMSAVRAAFGRKDECKLTQ